MNNTKYEIVDGIRSIPKESKSPKLWIVLLKDLGDYALYLNKSDGCFSGFEIHKIRIREARKCLIHNKTVFTPKRRILANSKEFGRYAWHYPNLDEAFKEYPIFKNYKQDILRVLEKVI
jgi:hypothetical protein